VKTPRLFLRRGALATDKNLTVLCYLLAGHWISAGAAFGHSVGIHGAGSATLSAIRISGTRNSNGRLTGRRSWICGLGLAHSRLPILSVRFSYAGILSAGARANQHRCRHQGNHPLHHMPPLSKDHAQTLKPARTLCGELGCCSAVYSLLGKVRELGVSRLLFV
jgi:hypothetical protein